MHGGGLSATQTLLRSCMFVRTWTAELAFDVYTSRPSHCMSAFEQWLYMDTLLNDMCIFVFINYCVNRRCMPVVCIEGFLSLFQFSRAVLNLFKLKDFNDCPWKCHVINNLNFGVNHLCWILMFLYI